MDLAISNWFFNTFGKNKALTMVVRIVTELGSAWFIIACVAVLLIFKKTRKVGLFALFACGLAFIANNLILKNIVQRARPFVANPELKGLCELVGYAFPTGHSMASGHATASMALAVTILLFNKKFGILAICVSLFVGLTRIYLCVHYLTDVIVGFIIGAVFAIGVYFLLKFIQKKILEKRGKNNEKINLSNKKSA